MREARPVEIPWPISVLGQVNVRGPCSGIWTQAFESSSRFLLTKLDPFDEQELRGKPKVTPALAVAVIFKKFLLETLRGSFSSLLSVFNAYSHS